MDDDGSAYIYVGGGIPSPDKASNPGTARVAKLNDDMISLATDPQPIENVPYLFEDSGINKIDGTYYYSYCSNFSMTPEGVAEYKFNQGQIILMTSDNPMGPFELYGPILKNPQDYFGRGGNNHHCIFNFKGEWYITYHSRILEEAMGMDAGYRSTNVDRLIMSEEGKPVMSAGTKSGVTPVATLNPYEEVSAVTLANGAGFETVQYGEEAVKYGSGSMILTGIHDGSYTGVYNAEFGDKGPGEITLKVRGKGKGVIKVCLDFPGGAAIGYVPVEAPGEEFKEVTVSLLSSPTGNHAVYFVYSGEDYEVLSWQFK